MDYSSYELGTEFRLEGTYRGTYRVLGAPIKGYTRLHNSRIQGCGGVSGFRRKGEYRQFKGHAALGSKSNHMGFASYAGYIGIMEKNMETTIVYWSHIGGLLGHNTFTWKAKVNQTMGSLQDFTVEGAPPHHCLDNPFHSHASAGDSCSRCVARRGFRK